MQIALKLQAVLEEKGYTVILTRPDNYTGISCSERAQIANNAGADVFLRIHADGSESSSASGEMGICITSSNPYVPGMYSESRRLTDCVLNEYVAATGLSSRSVWETDTMTGNNWSNVPTTLLEMGFMTNPNEDALMADPAFQDKMVDGIANGIDKFCFTD
jgi:N-acetylmuramoyl-L-alanine amidase